MFLDEKQVGTVAERWTGDSKMETELSRRALEWLTTLFALLFALAMASTQPAFADDLGEGEGELIVMVEEGDPLEGPEAPVTRLDIKSGKVILAKPFGINDHLRELRIEEGKSVSVETAYRIKRVSVGDPEILDVVVMGKRELQFVANGLGATNVLVWDQDNNVAAVIEVSVGTALAHISSQLREVLGNEQIELKNAGDSVILHGNVSTAIAMEQAIEVTKAFLRNTGDEDNEEADEEDLEQRVVNLLEVGGGHQVMLEVRIAEMDRTITRNLGTNFNIFDIWNGNEFIIRNTLGGIAASSANLGITGIGSDSLYSFFFEVLERNGLAKLLAEPTLIARSGESANFLVGGEVPIPVVQGGDSDAVTIVYKEFGVGLEFSPTVLSSDRIHLVVKPEVSEPDFNFGTTVRGTTVPGFITRRASTTIELGDGQSFAVAGLLRDNVIESVEKYPILGDVPILGILFRSTKFEKKATELVIIVTPRIVKPVEADSLAIPTDHFIEPSAAEWFLLARLEGGGTTPAEENVEQTQPQQSYQPMSPGGGIIGNAGHRVTAEPKLQETEE